MLALRHQVLEALLRQRKAQLPHSLHQGRLGRIQRDAFDLGCARQNLQALAQRGDIRLLA